MPTLYLRQLLLLLCLILPGIQPGFATEISLSAANQVILIRHALAPGTGDPANIDLSDCSTQRNLNQSGREQSRRIGGLFRAGGVEQAFLYSSRWCRCVETAELMDLGPVEVLESLNSFFNSPEKGPGQIRDLQQWLAAQDLSAADKPVVLVTHQVVITGLLRQLGENVFPSSGELVILQRADDGRFSLAGTIRTQ